MRALAHATLGVVMGLCIVLPIHLMVVSTLVESTSGSLELLKEKKEK